jgi:Uma2 family endonuclease
MIGADVKTIEFESQQRETKRKILPEILPPLENGDRLTRQEFERRYEALPQIKKAELIEGVVYMAAAVRITHGRPHGRMLNWIGAYCLKTPHTDYADNTSVRLDEENEVQPDVLLYIDSSAGGQSSISVDEYVEGAPELIVEISVSSASYDLHQKMDVYRRHGVREYIVWQVYENHLDWFHLHEGRYVPLTPDTDEIIRSQVFPGLHLAVDALLADDFEDVIATLQQGLQTEEHATFVRRLTQHEQL